MTIIVCDGHSLVVDSAALMGGIVHSVQKFVYSKQYVAAAFGPQPIAAAYLNWYPQHGSTRLYVNMPKFGGTDEPAGLVVFDRAGNLELLTVEATAFINVYPPKVALGDGAAFAYGALAHGANAYDAAKIACTYSPFCGGELHSFRTSGTMHGVIAKEKTK